MRHRARTLLAGREILLGLEHLGALQVADLDRQPLDAAGDHREGGEIHRVAIARYDLCRYRLDRETELLSDIFFDLRIDIGKGADRARNGAGGDFGARRDQPRTAAVKFGIGLRELQPEGHRLGVDAVAAADGGGVFVLLGAGLDRGEQRVEIGDQDIARPGQLHRERGVEHVGAGHALMHEAGFLAHFARHPVEEGDHVMLGHRLDRVDRGDVDGRVGGPPVPQRLGGGLRHDAEIGELLGRVRLDLEPDAVLGFRLPQSGHLRAGVAGDHVRLRCGWFGARGRVGGRSRQDRARALSVSARDLWRRSLSRRRCG